ncbi:MAG: GNAT family N-acetyltransferase [Candidatus Poribacteria bacterium]|nr:GNAT family N-acetyltransferase [Candidatus Poribacteria bacterium]
MSEIMHVKAHQVSPSLKALFDVGQPVAIRCFAVLDGSIRGQIWTDDLAQPTWGAVQEAAFDTLFLGGCPSASLVHPLIDQLRQESEVALALWPDHPYNQLLPPAPDFDGWELEFTDRLLGADPVPDLSVPDGCELRPIDATWFERCRYRDYYAAYFGSVERTLEKGFGFCLVKEHQLLSEAFAGDAALGMIEIGTITGEPYRRRGYATFCCAQLIRECEARGYRTYWNCAKNNLASAGLARRMGYQTEKEFRFVVWDPPDRSDDISEGIFV